MEGMPGVLQRALSEGNPEEKHGFMEGLTSLQPAGTSSGWEEEKKKIQGIVGSAGMSSRDPWDV